jgi:signal transduction histidine kinase
MTASAEEVRGTRWVTETLASRALGVLALGLAGWMVATTVSNGESSLRPVVSGLVVLWAATGLLLAVQQHGDPTLGTVVSGAAALAAVGLRSDVVQPFALALVPWAGMSIVLAMPSGALRGKGRRVFVILGGVAGLTAGAVLFGHRQHLPAWPFVAMAVVAAGVSTVGFAARYGSTDPSEQRRMKWLAWGAMVASGLAVTAFGLYVLVEWPTHPGVVAIAATALLPVSIVLGTNRRAAKAIDPLLARTITAGGLTAIVVAVYLAVVLGLGRVPRHDERTLLALSMAAAVLALLVYLGARGRLKAFATRAVYGHRRAPEDVVRNFGSRLSRSIPLDELLLQLVENLRATLALSAAEVWMESGGRLERTVSDPDRPVTAVELAGPEEATVARAGVSGPAWAKIWLPGILAERPEAAMRVAPVTHSGELLALLVIERDHQAEVFTAEDERLLGDLARQVGLTLHNVRLDSALQASLDQVRRQAEALPASSGRIVAAADAERRRIERDIHDGAQQQLVALAVRLRLARQFVERDPAKAGAMLAELGQTVEDTLRELRELAHGIYPPLLLDKGLPEALASAARRSILPAQLVRTDVGRYSPEVEAAVYFCCLEALQNAAKHAGTGASLAIRLWEDQGGLLFEVADDGVGFDARRKSAGVGFTNMNDRLGAIGGSLRVESAPGRGTKIQGAVPLAS